VRIPIYAFTAVLNLTRTSLAERGGGRIAAAAAANCALKMPNDYFGVFSEAPSVFVGEPFTKDSYGERR
jgi:hypothetical protein